MNDSTEDKLKGAGHKVSGTVKEKVGQMTNNPDLETEGTTEKAGGTIQKKVGDIEKVFEK